MVEDDKKGYYEIELESNKGSSSSESCSPEMIR